MMSPFPAPHDVNPSTLSLMTWLMAQVLKLPPDARSSLKVDSLPLVGFTDVRRAAHGNQDRVAVAYSIGQDVATSWFLAVVCDGVGGSLHGERAAALAVAAIAIEIADSSKMNAAEMLREAFQTAHFRTSAAFQSKSSTTAVALLVAGNTAAIGWVGDSRAYQISGGKASLLTTDDTFAGAMARADSSFKFDLNEEYAERLSQAIGGENSVTPNVIDWPSSAADASCLLCTDGIWKPTEPAFDTMVDACRDGPELMRRLLLLSDWMGGTDNASAILIPPLGTVRKFICDSSNATPNGAMVICLPGPMQTLIPVSDFKSTPRSIQLMRQSPRADQSEEMANDLKKLPNKRKAGGPSKGRSKQGASVKNQLVIEEEPLDDTSPHPTGKI